MKEIEEMKKFVGKLIKEMQMKIDVIKLVV